MLPVWFVLFSIAGMRRRLILLALVTFVTMPLVGRAAGQQTDKQRSSAAGHRGAERGGAERPRRSARPRPRGQSTTPRWATLQAQLAAANDHARRRRRPMSTASAFAAFLLSIEIDKTEKKLAVADADVRDERGAAVQEPATASTIEPASAAPTAPARSSRASTTSSACRPSVAATCSASTGCGEARRPEGRARRRSSSRPTRPAPPPPTTTTRSPRSSRSRQQRAQRRRAAPSRPRAPARRRARAAGGGRSRPRRRSPPGSPRCSQAAGDGPPMGNGRFLRPVGRAHHERRSATAPTRSPVPPRTTPGSTSARPCGTPIKAAGNGVGGVRRVRTRRLRQHDAHQPRRRPGHALRPPVGDRRVGGPDRDRRAR